jgi:hypothetical protein
MRTWAFSHSNHFPRRSLSKQQKKNIRLVHGAYECSPGMGFNKYYNTSTHSNTMRDEKKNSNSKNHLSLPDWSLSVKFIKILHNEIFVKANKASEGNCWETSYLEKE